MSMRKGKSRIQGRTTLTDISNMPQGFRASNQFHKSEPSSNDLRKHIEQIQKVHLFAGDISPLLTYHAFVGMLSYGVISSTSAFLLLIELEGGGSCVTMAMEMEVSFTVCNGGINDS
ncbi:hypothetical protein L1987_01330 [Smallanthus sonchifolius]|uniref:Uncharacterized protein n=1 Tax=Smallanthus sonchifolius TaxID=185202 RepID=A0ACB9K4T3_9ASTR|nr:hypothetical protein L1987_01330 [Smallanthus sonchifolius]